MGRIVESAVHSPLPEFAQQTLFAPLGIRRADWRWHYTLTQVIKEYAQIHLRPRDMLKIGLLYAQHGQWRGQQVTFNAAQGNGGQQTYIVPQYQLVLVLTGSDYNSGGSPPNKIMAQVILPRLLEAYRAPRATIEPAAAH